MLNTKTKGRTLSLLLVKLLVVDGRSFSIAVSCIGLLQRQRQRHRFWIQKFNRRDNGCYRFASLNRRCGIGHEKKIISDDTSLMLERHVYITVLDDGFPEKNDIKHCERAAFAPLSIDCF